MSKVEEYEDFPYQYHPLMNHLVLKKILNYLPNKAILNCRSVCKTWLEEFSKYLIVTFVSLEDLEEFISNVNKDEDNLKYFRRFDLTYVKDAILKINSEELLELLTKLTSVFTIKEITLPFFESKEYIIGPVLKLISENIESLELCMVELYSEHFDPPLAPHLYVQFDTIELTKLTKLKVSYWSSQELTSSFIYDIFKISPFIQEFQAKIFNSSPEEICNLIATLTIVKPEYLKILKIDSLCNDFLQVNFSMSDLLTSVKSLENFEFNGIPLKRVDISDFFILAYKLNLETDWETGHGLIDDGPPGFFDNLQMLEVQENNNIQENDAAAKIIQMPNLKVFKYYFLTRFPLKKILVNFPNLEELPFLDYLSGIGNFDKFSIMECNFSVPYKSMKSFNYAINNKWRGFSSNNLMDGITQKITEIFPNLTTLQIDISRDFIAKEKLNLTPIFANLIKLKEFSFTSLNEFYSDAEITGISTDFIEKNLKDIHFEFLLNFKIHNEIPQNLPGIGDLKDLTKLTFKVRSESTLISFIFGFLKLQKLEFVTIFASFLKKVDKKFWGKVYEKWENLLEFEYGLDLINYTNHDLIVIDHCSVRKWDRSKWIKSNYLKNKFVIFY